MIASGSDDKTIRLWDVITVRKSESAAIWKIFLFCFVFCFLIIYSGERGEAGRSKGCNDFMVEGEEK